MPQIIECLRLKGWMLLLSSAMQRFEQMSEQTSLEPKNIKNLPKLQQVLEVL
jgi:hypothetical protein